MGTRSRIGIKLTDGSILSAYHHYDGYPQWLGRQLVEHYNTKDKVSELIDGGDMSVCYSTDTWNSRTVYQTIVKSDGTTQKVAMKNPDGSYLQDIQKETPSPLYYSERGEDCPPRLDSNLFEYLSNGEEYAYVFENGSWVAYDLHQFEDDKEPEVVSIPE